MSLWGTQRICMTPSCVSFCYLRTFLNSCPLDPWCLEQECPWKVPRITEFNTFPFLLSFSSLPQGPHSFLHSFQNISGWSCFQKYASTYCSTSTTSCRSQFPKVLHHLKIRLWSLFARNKLRLRHLSLFLK